MAVLYREELCRLLALEYNCHPADFDRGENTLTRSMLHEGRRVYGSEPYFFHMVTMGGNAVMTADERLHDFLRSFMADRTGHWLFELPNLLPLEGELNRFGYTLSQTHHMFLPRVSGTPTELLAARDDVEIRWFEGEEILPFYGDPRLPNAICPEPTKTRPDRVVVCAYEGEELVGMAGCSEDAPGWMQIGIDIVPAYRSRGLGSHLVALLKERILEMEAIPFYGTSVSNYHSWSIALNCGFFPAWIEIGASPLSPSLHEKGLTVLH
jgi:RimJ/RimL family protein N-acetyltransferase